MRVLAELKKPTGGTPRSADVDLVVDELRRWTPTAPTARSWCSPSTRPRCACCGAAGRRRPADGSAGRRGAPRPLSRPPACARSRPTRRASARPATASCCATRRTRCRRLGPRARGHDAGLAVIPWALRGENAFLPRTSGAAPTPAPGDADGEARLLLALGVDGVITDCPDVAVRVRAELEQAAVRRRLRRRDRRSRTSWPPTACEIGDLDGVSPAGRGRRRSRRGPGPRRSPRSAPRRAPRAAARTPGRWRQLVERAGSARMSSNQPGISS